MSRNNAESHSEGDNLDQEIYQEDVQVDEHVLDHGHNWAELVIDFEDFKVLDQGKNALQNKNNFGSERLGSIVYLRVDAVVPSKNMDHIQVVSDSFEVIKLVPDQRRDCKHNRVK